MKCNKVTQERLNIYILLKTTESTLIDFEYSCKLFNNGICVDSLGGFKGRDKTRSF